MNTSIRICRCCNIEQPLDNEHFRLRNGRTYEWICRGCTRLKHHNWYIQNREPERQKAKDRYYANPEKKRQRAKQAMRQYRSDPIKAEHERQRKRDYYAQNKDKVLAETRRKYRLHAPIRRLSARNRYARRKGATENWSPDEIKTMYRSQRGRCWWCEIPIGEKYHLDHRIPLSRGGSNSIRNIVIACVHCNESKKDKLPYEWIGRLL